MVARSGDRPRSLQGDGLPVFGDGHSFGADIDAAHRVLLDDAQTPERKRQALIDWMGRYQPCLFGRMAAREARGAGAAKGLGFFVCWLDARDLSAGGAHVGARIAQARRAWKEQAWQGRALAFLIVFNTPALAQARPGPDLLELAADLTSLYVTEHAPVVPDTIYTEAIPLRMPDGGTALFKSTVQLFYTGAHGTRSHDRRVPGGLVLSMVAPGHYAHCLVRQGVHPTLAAAAEFVRETAYRSIGTGGIGHPRGIGSSWHNRLPEGCPARAPRDEDPTSYSAAYQTDVTLPSSVADAAACDDPAAGGDVWAELGLRYLSAEQVPPDHVNHGWFTGLPVTEAQRFDNPWPALHAVNGPALRLQY
jgi:hypothetical protein